jgi:PAS domain S-box-containing protein
MSQRIHRNLLQLHQTPPVPGDARLSELVHAIALFDDTLMGFAKGGKTRNQSGEDVELHRVTLTSAQTPLADGLALWNTFIPLLQPIDAGLATVPSVPQVNAALAFADAHANELYDQMDKLTTALVIHHEDEMTALRWMQGLFMVLMLISGVWVMAKKRQLTQAMDQENKELAHTTETTQAQLLTVQARMYLLDMCIAKIKDVVIITEFDSFESVPFKKSNPRMVYVNDAFEKVTGYSREEAIGQTPCLLHGPKSQRSELDRMHCVFGSWSNVRGEVINYTKSGEEFWVEYDVTPVASDKGWYTLSVQRDITERKKNEAEMIELMQMAAESSRLKSEFLRNISHELRTPMNGILGMSQILTLTALNKEQAKYVKTLRDCASSFLTVVNHVLDFRKLDAGTLTIEQQPFGVQAMLDACLVKVQSLAREKKLALTLTCNQNVPSQLVGDARRISQVLGYLLDNAVKFTATGSVALTVSLISHEGDVFGLRFAVHDTGIGISDDQMEMLFRPFVQVDGTLTRRYGGTGMGLALSRKLVKLMNGREGVESQPLKGSTFWFELELPQASAEITLTSS